MERVLVTGATGFIGLHCIQQALDAGYLVRGTVRSMARADEVKNAMRNAGCEVANLEIVEADLLQDNGWGNAVTDCDYVLHVASPFIIGVPKHEDELIIPAREGAERVLNAAIAARVKKVVLTSSCAAIHDTFDGKTRFNEDDWSDASNPKIPAYNKSKTLAERRAWEIINAQKGETKTQMAVINPAGVVGPMLTDDPGTSNVFINRFITGEMPGCINMHIGFVDVRDVASAHLAAMTNDAANGERFIISERELWFKDVADVLRAAGFDKAPSRILPNWLVRLLAFTSAELKQLSQFLGHERYTPADKARKILGWNPRDARDSLVETANQFTTQKS